ncbi:MAG: nitroreductase family protein [Oscillospiraceae bacterium]|nr:nitroreductase family protein [Oscillospiraceae bacterium]
MNTLECLKERRSIRRFKAEKIPHEVFEKIIDAARYSPSWKNTQIARYFIVESKDALESIASNCLMGFEHNIGIVKNAAAVAVLAYVEKRSGYERDGSFTTSKAAGWEMFDAGIAALSFCLAARENGVGTCIMGIFDEKTVAEAVNLPDGMCVGALIAMGYPDESPAPPPRKEISQLLTFV